MIDVEKAKARTFVIVHDRLTFKDLKKRVSLDSPQLQSMLSDRLQNKQFWIWDKQQHKQEDVRTDGDCCFNHIIGLPTKERKRQSLIMRKYYTMLF